MNNNDLLRRIRYALHLGDPHVAHIFGLANLSLAPEQVGALMAHEGEAGALLCTDELLGGFLNGLIIERRGPPAPGTPAASADRTLSNNEILKRLRIALNLRSADVIEILAVGGQPMSKSELGALFRSPDHPHYRECGNQVLRKFLSGLTARLRPPAPTRPAGEAPPESGGTER